MSVAVGTWVGAMRIFISVFNALRITEGLAMPSLAPIAT